MKTNGKITKTNLSGKKTNFDNFELQILNEREMDEINGGAHYENIAIGDFDPDMKKISEQNTISAGCINNNLLSAMALH